MEIRLLGTGSGDGWPDPWCDCASCAALRAAGTVRAPTAVLVDGTLLLGDRGSAPHLGASLTGVRSVVPGRAPTAGAVGAVGVWPPGVEVVGPLAAGTETVLASGHRLRVGDDPSPTYVVTAPDGTRLLHAPGPIGALPDGRYDTALLACPDLDGWLRTVADLRRRGAVDARTTVAPVHLGHTAGSSAELARRVRLAGGTLLADGAAAGSPTSPPRARRVLITGGMRSGKSLEAERRLLAEPAVTYVATSLPRPGDDEWARRLALHRARRPAHWETVETLELAPLLADPAAVLLIDCATLWLGAHLESPDRAAAVDGLVEAWGAARAVAVLVTNEVGSGVVPATASGRAFADALGRLNARLAEGSDEVWHVVSGIAVRLR